MFERTPKRLHRGSVVSVALATHGRDAAVRRQSLPIGCAGELACAVGMVHHLAQRTTLHQGQVQ